MLRSERIGALRSSSSPCRSRLGCTYTSRGVLADFVWEGQASKDNPAFRKYFFRQKHPPPSGALLLSLKQQKQTSLSTFDPPGSVSLLQSRRCGSGCEEENRIFFHCWIFFFFSKLLVKGSLLEEDRSAFFPYLGAEVLSCLPRRSGLSKKGKKENGKKDA